MDPRQQHDQLITRRHFFGRSSTGIGVAALASLLNSGQLGRAAIVQSAGRCARFAALSATG